MCGRMHFLVVEIAQSLGGSSSWGTRVAKAGLRKYGADPKTARKNSRGVSWICFNDIGRTKPHITISISRTPNAAPSNPNLRVSRYPTAQDVIAAVKYTNARRECLFALICTIALVNQSE